MTRGGLLGNIPFGLLTGFEPLEVAPYTRGVQECRDNWHVTQPDTVEYFESLIGRATKIREP